MGFGGSDLEQMLESSAMLRVARLPLVQSALQSLSSAYTQVKGRHPLLQIVGGVAEVGVVSVSQVALKQATPLITSLEPQLEAANSLVLLGLDRLEQNFPILQQSTDEVASHLKDAVALTLDDLQLWLVGGVDAALEQVEHVTERGRGLFLLLQRSTLGRAASSGLDDVLTRLEELTAFYLPLPPTLHCDGHIDCDVKTVTVRLVTVRLCGQTVIETCDGQTVSVRDCTVNCDGQTVDGQDVTVRLVTVKAVTVRELTVQSDCEVRDCDGQQTREGQTVTSETVKVRDCDGQNVTVRRRGRQQTVTVQTVTVNCEETETSDWTSDYDAQRDCERTRLLNGPDCDGQTVDRSDCDGQRHCTVKNCVTTVTARDWDCQLDVVRNCDGQPWMVTDCDWSTVTVETVTVQRLLTSDCDLSETVTCQTVTVGL
uniref:Uncharacterized protein n=1 Tax=Knipowitschia caucasica TaxID=637954 RepID=A0AAV2ME09_KNICA